MPVTSPTQRTKAACAALGWAVGVTEKWVAARRGTPCALCGSNEIPKQGRRVDLFGFVDLIALTPEGVLFLQVTSGTNLASRMRKIIYDCYEDAASILRTPNTAIEIWGWRKLKGKGRRKWWAKRKQLLIEGGSIKIVDLEDI